MKTDRRIGLGMSVESYRHPLLSKINLYLEPLKGLVDPAGRRWSPLTAAMAAVLMSLDAAKALFVRLREAHGCMQALPWAAGVGRTYNGLMKALIRQGPLALPVLRAHLRQKALEALRKIPSTGGWRLLAVDGTKEHLPRTKDLEDDFGIADNGKCPQALVTVVVEVHTGVLWDWRVDRGAGSEKGHIEAMACGLPDEALLLADGNFVGYGVWRALAEAGKWFLIRVGGNVDLLTGLFPDAAIERQGDIVYAWPKNKQRDCPPLRLRLLRVGRGKKAVYLLTNVLDEKRLDLKTAGTLYRLRWGAEIFCRTFKRTMDMAKVKCRSGLRAKLELEWALIACSIISLLGVEALVHAGKDPRRLSPASLVHACRNAMLHGANATDFQKELSTAVRDPYQRHTAKQSRHRPITKNTPKSHHLKPPNLRWATPQEQLHARQQCQKMAA